MDIQGEAQLALEIVLEVAMALIVRPFKRQAKQSYVQVEHFSRYGVLDETDSDEDVLSKTGESRASLSRRAAAAAAAADGHDIGELRAGSDDMQEGPLPANSLPTFVHMLSF